MSSSNTFTSRRDIVANWQPDNKDFWESYGKKIAKQNLVVSTLALTLSFCVWYLWSTIASQLNGAGFNFTTDQLFTLAAFPGLVGATLRFVYTALIAVGVDLHSFPFFFSMSVITFVFTGFITGASFRMIPHIFTDGLQGSLVTGFTAAVAAYGAFITPKIFGFTYTTFGNIHPAFAVLLAFNIVTVAVCYWFYVRKGANINV